MECAADDDGWPKSEAVGEWARPTSAHLVVTRRFLPEAHGVRQDIPAADERPAESRHWGGIAREGNAPSGTRDASRGGQAD